MSYTNFHPSLVAGTPRHQAHPGQYLVTLLRTWRQRARQHRELARLTERDIRDAGSDPGQIEYEMNKPFWRA